MTITLWPVVSQLVVGKTYQFGWWIKELQYPSDSRYKVFHEQMHLHQKRNTCAVCVGAKCVHKTNKTCDYVYETCYHGASVFALRVERVWCVLANMWKRLHPIGSNVFTLLVKCVSQRIQHVYFALMDSQACSLAVIVSMYHVDNLDKRL